MSNPNAIPAAIYTTLTGGTALTALLASGTAVYRNRATDHAVYPFIVYNFFGGGPENLTSHREQSTLWAVKCYSTVWPGEAGTIAAQVDALLDGNTLTVAGFTNFWTARESDLELENKLPSGETEYMVGGIYRIRIHS